MSMKSQIGSARVNSEWPDRNVRGKHRVFFIFFLKYHGRVLVHMFLELLLKST